LVGRLRDAAIGNVRVHVGDALDVLERSPDGWLSGVHVFFPDPWPKVRHERRRLVQPWFASLCARVLQPGGLLHLATDVEAYATRAERTLASEARFERCPAPCRAETRYERKGRAAGRPAIDLAWRRLPDA
jgi:tRNA (guanine-N7-)-methyltransferase